MDKGIPISARVVPNRGSIDWRKVAARLLSRAEAAEARLEELTRERDAAITRCGEWAADFARKCARLEEAKAVLGKAEGKLVELYRSATPHANYDNELGINGHTSGNRFADTDDAVLAVRSFLHQGGEDAV